MERSKAGTKEKRSHRPPGSLRTDAVNELPKPAPIVHPPPTGEKNTRVFKKYTKARVVSRTLAN